jgi:hypothetical protein
MASAIAVSVHTWLNQRLACEREGHVQAASASTEAACCNQLAGLPAAALLAEIRRQRLVNVLAADLPLLDQHPRLKPLASGLRRLQQQETQAALALLHCTRSVVALFARADLPLLVLKGIPLAVQTCGSPTARGRGDLDLLVPPTQLPAAVHLLESAGFERPPGLFPRDLRSFWGRYSRWVGYELSLRRQGPLGPEWVDLHWSLAPVRDPLPGFSQLWQRRQCVQIQGELLPTLGRCDAVLFAAAHGAKDDWHSLRHMVDLERLARLLDHDELRALRRQRLVRLSAGVAHRCVPAPNLLALSQPGSPAVRRAVAIADGSQALPLPIMLASQPWSLRRWMVMLRRQVSLSRHPIDWLRIMLSYTLLPAAFNDPLTGADRGLLLMLQSRWDRLRQRRRERFSGSLPASARSAPGP